MRICYLKPHDIPQMVALKLLCWPEEINGLSSYTPDASSEVLFWQEWMKNQNLAEDKRTLLGIFQQEQLIGVGIASFAESLDADNGIEINGLWIHPQYRKQGLAIYLFYHLLSNYYSLNKIKIIIYTFHHALSRSFYDQFQAKTMRHDTQLAEKVLVDILEIDFLFAHSFLKQYVDKNKAIYSKIQKKWT